MSDIKKNDRIECLNCHWNGLVRDLKAKRTSPREEDAIDFMQCPNCNESLAIRGWVNFIIIPAKTKVMAQII